MDTPARAAPALRPLGVGDIVDRVFALYRQRPLVFIALSAVPYLLFTLVLVVGGVIFAVEAQMTGLMEFLVTSSRPTRADFERFLPVIVTAIVYGIAATIAAIVILSAQTAGLIDAASSLHLGRPTSFGEAIRRGLRATPRLIGASLLIVVLVVGLWIVAGVLMVVSQQGLVVAGLVMLALVGTVYVFASTVVAPVVVTQEGAGPVTALRRSWALSDGNRWRILGLQLLLLVLNVVIGALLSVVFVGSLLGNETVQLVVQQVANLAVQVLWAPVQWATMAILYYDLRVRREAFDLQLAAEALPRA